MGPARFGVRRSIRNDEHGQASVEYALLLFSFLAMVAGLSALWHAGRDGSLQRHARDAASHALAAEGGSNSPWDLDMGQAKDLLLY